jgi:spermidine/putrescine transport system permease protein
MSQTLTPTPEQPAPTDEARQLERRAADARARQGAWIALPPALYLILLFALPLLIVFVYSFATRGTTGATILADWNLASYRRLFNPLVREIVLRSVGYALVTTIISLVLSYPFAYYIATRPARMRNVLLVLVMIPFWSNFLVRTYAWRVLLSSSGPVSQLTGLLGMGQTRLLFTTTAVILGLVYGYMPFMILPLYAAIERIDLGLVEAARDLYASGAKAFWRVTWPLSRPGVIAGSILVFIPSLGAYVTPEILGGSKTTMLGSYIVRQFLSARDWPFGSALSFVVMALMLGATLLYFRTGGRTL